MDNKGEHKDLSKWIALLSKYNEGQPMGKENITRIEDFFNFYWTNNKMTPFRSEMDKRFMLELPHLVTQQIYIEYVF